MKRLYINGRFLTQPMTGINRFAYEVCKELNNLLDFELVVPNDQIYDCYNVSDFKIKKLGKLKSHLWEQISLCCFFRRHKDSFLISFSGIGPILYSHKISTIHDVSFLQNSKWFSKSYYYLYKTLTPLLIKTSKCVFTVSEFSKSEIIKHYGDFVKRIEVAYNAVNLDTLNVSERRPIPKTVLTVGSIDPRKNLKNLIESFNLEILRDVKLKIIGNVNKVFGSPSIPNIKYDNVEFLGRVSDAELAKAYSEASLFVSSSLYEGFGIPPLEALSAGCPIALSDIPVYHEIFENSAAFFNPRLPNSIANCIIKNLNNEVSVEDQHNILGKYSWRISAKKIANVIREYI